MNESIIEESNIYRDRFSFLMVNMSKSEETFADLCLIYLFC